MSKTYRKYKGRKYYDKDRSKGILSVSTGCLHGGGCPWCEGNRTHKNRRREPVVELSDLISEEEIIT